MIKSVLKTDKIVLHNRLVMPPMASETSIENRVSEATLEFYTRRGRGGNIGLIVTEHMYIDPRGKASPRQISVADESCIEGLSRLTEAIHACGSKCIAQINHAGCAARESETGMRPLAPSKESFSRRGKVEPEELSPEGIEHIIKAFAEAALRVKKAGYDGVEIHSAHGYLLNQFYSPLANFRKDEYGGSLEGRIAIHKRVIRAVREQVGEDFLLALRLGGCDYQEGGSSIEDAVQAALAFEKEGIDIIDLSGGFCGYIRSGHEFAPFRDMGLAVKSALKIPVILTGGVKDRAGANSLLLEGSADLVGVGRALLNDPDWADKNL